MKNLFLKLTIIISVVIIVSYLGYSNIDTHTQENDLSQKYISNKQIQKNIVTKPKKDEKLYQIDLLLKNLSNKSKHQNKVKLYKTPHSYRVNSNSSNKHQYHKYFGYVNIKNERIISKSYKPVSIKNNQPYHTYSDNFNKRHSGNENVVNYYPSCYSTNTNPHHEYVNGYYKKNGTYVDGYYRTSRNNTKTDNFIAIMEILTPILEK